MHEDNFAQVIVRSLICLKACRRKMKMQNDMLSATEFNLCGGKIKKHDGGFYSLKRQVTLAERGFRSLITGKQNIFDKTNKAPAKKQMKDMIDDVKLWLDDEMHDWATSDDENISNIDPTETDNDEDSENDSVNDEKEIDDDNEDNKDKEDDGDEEDDDDKEEDDDDKEEDDDDQNYSDEDKDDDSEKDEDDHDDEDSEDEKNDDDDDEVVD